MGKAENEARKLKEFRKKLTTRDDVQEILQLYDDRRIKALEARLWWCEQPFYRKVWLKVSRWARETAHPWCEARIFRPVRRTTLRIVGKWKGWW